MPLKSLDQNTFNKNLYSITWSEFGSSLIATAQNLRGAEDLTDVTISAGGKIFSAHKLVLSAASPLLMELLKNTKCSHPILMLAGISAFDLERILDFVYQGEVNIDSDKLPSLLQAAQFLDIRALSTTVLVLNSWHTTLDIPTTEICKSDVHIGTEESITATTIGVKNVDSTFPSLKRKIVDKPTEVEFLKTAKPIPFVECPLGQTDGVKNNNGNAVNLVPENTTHSLPKVSLKMNGTENEQDNLLDEKKIISDLPVKCKLCDVTIRQSRNLRRHIDQMHSKSKLKKKDNKKNTRLIKNPGQKNIKERNNINPSPLDFSEDSFSQLTEEILNYSVNSETVSNENSFSSSPSVTSNLIDACLIDDAIPGSSDTSASSPGV